MRRRSSLTDDEGSAALEFVLVGLMMIVFLFYLVIVLAEIQAKALAVESASRHLAHIAAAHPWPAQVDIDRVSAGVAREYGMRPGDLDVDIRCEPADGECTGPGALVRVEVRAAVVLPFVPHVLGFDRVARIQVQAESVRRVTRVAGRGGG